jgi:RNA polymerase sigma factor for flagellar operon FliA
MLATAASPHPAQALRAYQSGANEDTLIERHLSLVRTTVDRMRLFLPAVLDMEDLYSVGFNGLLSAARKFDPANGATFPSFATLHIRGAVHDELRRMDWTPRSIREKAKRFSESLSRIEQRLGRAATESEVCAELALTPDQYEVLLDEIRPASFVPLDGEVFSEESDDVSLHEIIADDTQTSGREELEKKELLQLVIGQLQKLPEIPKKVLAMYYFEGMRLAEIAAVFGVTEGRISQIHTQAVLSLRTFIRRQEAVPAAA